MLLGGRETNETAVFCVHGIEKSVVDNNIIITDTLKMDEFYTLHILWGTKDNNFESFYSLFKDRKCLIEQTSFACNLIPHGVNNFLSLGAQYSSNSRPPSYYFSGAISNLEVLKSTVNIPPVLLNLVIREQNIDNFFALDDTLSNVDNSSST